MSTAVSYVRIISLFSVEESRRQQQLRRATGMRRRRSPSVTKGLGPLWDCRSRPMMGTARKPRAMRTQIRRQAQAKTVKSARFCSITSQSNKTNLPRPPIWRVFGHEMITCCPNKHNFRKTFHSRPRKHHYGTLSCRLVVYGVRDFPPLFSCVSKYLLEIFCIRRDLAGLLRNHIPKGRNVKFE